MPVSGQLRGLAAEMLHIFYTVYKDSKILPIMPHCDNDFETFALKHTFAVELPVVEEEARRGKFDGTETS